MAVNDATILGLDTSSLRCGWGVVHGRVDPQKGLLLTTPSLRSLFLDLEHLGHGVIELDKKEPHPGRQCRLQEEIAALILFYGVEKIAIEELKSMRNPKVLRILQGYITAASMACWRLLGEEPILINQETIRKRIGIHSLSPVEKRGRSSEEISLEMKTKVAEVINRELNLECGTFDETDALAVSIAGMWGP